MDYDAIIVGAGFAGLYMLHRLRQQGLRARVFERGDGVGGTWYWNRYPGARCDVESMEYSYQFDPELQQEWDWTERYAAQPEILAYANHVADRYHLRGDIQFHTSVAGAAFNEKNASWQVTTRSAHDESTGRAEQHHARFLIMATGCLSSSNRPDIAGQSSFAGQTYHTGEWPHDGVDFSGKDVAVIGTGSSAIQAIPEIAKQAELLFVLQRTPNYSIPAHNKPLSRETQAQIKADYAGLRSRAAQSPFGIAYDMNIDSALQAGSEERAQRYEEHWQKGGLGFLGAFGDLLFSGDANDTAAEFVRGKIRDIVDNPRVAEMLSPMQVLGCKRLCADTGYYETFNRDNVILVDLIEEPIQSILEQGVLTSRQVIEVDAIVYATGFDAMTGALNKIDIRGRQGLTLKQKWSEGPKTYLGIGSAGFPNLFMITGPGSPSVLTNMLPSIEQNVEWIAGCIGYLEQTKQQSIEATLEAEEAWVGEVNQLADQTLFPSCNSWYLGANIPGKPRVFMPYIGFPSYVEKCNQVVDEGYAGFDLR